MSDITNFPWGKQIIPIFDQLNKTVKQMVTITHSGENVQRIKQILTTAQAHFGLYGLEKTTMREIAEDLNISKGALYYYFSDKEHLYKAVIEKEQEEFLDLYRHNVSRIENPEDMLYEYIKIRSEHFRTLVNLSRLRMDELWALKPILESTWLSFHEKEVQIVDTILTAGVKIELFKIDDTKEIAELFLDLLKGLRHSLLKHKELMFIDQSEYESMIYKSKTLLKIFINGLKYNR